MRGYVYLDNDRNLNVRSEEFIESDPGFWGRNQHLINTVWPFDSENMDTMKRILFSFKNLELGELQVRDFCSQIGFNLKKFVEQNKAPPTVFIQPSL